MKAAAPWILIIAFLAYWAITEYGEGVNNKAERDQWQRERDSLATVNASLMVKVDSLTEAAKRHAFNADSLASIPHQHYIEHAARLTRSASLDSLGILLGADPFLTVPDPLNDHDEP